MALSISFYLLNPKAKSISQVYVSISNKISRLRFTTSESFKVECCNIRKIKGGKELLKRNSPFYIQYKQRLSSIEELLHKTEIDLTDGLVKPSLQDIRDAYYVRIGKTSDESSKTFDEVFKIYTSKQIQNLKWSESTIQINNALLMHINKFKDAGNEVSIVTFNHEVWQQMKLYFVGEKMANSSTNKYLKALKAFMRVAQDDGYIKDLIAWHKMEMLKNGTAFKIALKEDELDKLISLDLSENHLQGIARDLFVAQCLTGQRISDIHKVLDLNNNDGNGIVIYQQKTGERVFIPLHTKLKNHLDQILKKYPNGFPAIADQTINESLKEIFKEHKFNRKITRQQRIGAVNKIESKKLYEVCSSHDGRRTFCTLALKNGIDSEQIMKVSGHKKYDQFREYVTVDDDDLVNEYNKKF